MTDLGLLIARLMMSLVFLLSGLDKALHWSAGLAKIEAAGLPLAPLMLTATVITQLGGIDTLTRRLGANGAKAEPCSRFRTLATAPDVIRRAVWLYLRFTLSYRDVEDLLAERGLQVSNETVRRWVLKFGRS